MENHVTVIERTTGIRYTDEQRENARYVWTFRANRNASVTARLLTSPEFVDFGLSGVTDRTIREWAGSGDWDTIANRDIYEHQSNLRFLAQSEIRMAVPEASRFLREAIDLCRENMMQPVVGKDGPFCYPDGTPVMRLDANILKAGISAAQGLLDRGGFSPIGTREIGGLDAPPEIKGDVLEALNGLDDIDPERREEVLRQIEERVRSESRMGRSAGDTTQRKKRGG
jgi:hypothetical protein